VSMTFRAVSACPCTPAPATSATPAMPLFQTGNGKSVKVTAESMQRAVRLFGDETTPGSGLAAAAGPGAEAEEGAMVVAGAGAAAAAAAGGMGAGAAAAVGGVGAGVGGAGAGVGGAGGVGAKRFQTPAARLQGAMRAGAGGNSTFTPPMRPGPRHGMSGPASAAAKSSFTSPMLAGSRLAAGAGSNPGMSGLGNKRGRPDFGPDTPWSGGAG
jgi:hypothetical protein